MKRFLLVAMLLIPVGAATVGIPTFLALAADNVVFDGKKLIFPRDTAEDADISGLTFNLDPPSDKNYIAGNIYRTQFISRAKRSLGALRYVLFTKFSSSKIEMFNWPVSPRFKDDKSFLDCAPTPDNMIFNCAVRGRKVGADYRLVFKDSKQMAFLSSDGWEADLELVGTIPAQFINEHKAAD